MSDADPDIRIVRLVVSIAKCAPLDGYFFNNDSMAMASEYIDAEHHINARWGRISRYDLAEYFSSLYRDDPEKLARLMDYALTDIFRGHGTPDEWSSELSPYFEDFARDLRSLGYELSSGRVRLAVGAGSQEESRMIGELEMSLETISPELLKMHQGAWDTLRSGRPDSHRQAIASARELLNHALDALGGEGKRKEKISKILGGTDAETVESFGDFVNNLYALQSKGEHAEPTFERAFFVIKMTEYVLYYLLKSNPKSNLSQSD